MLPPPSAVGAAPSTVGVEGWVASDCGVRAAGVGSGAIGVAAGPGDIAGPNVEAGPVSHQKEKTLMNQSSKQTNYV